MNAVDVRNEILSWQKNVPELRPGDVLLKSSEKGLIIGMMSGVLRMEGKRADGDQRRYQVLAWLFRDQLGKPMASGVSTKELDDSQWWCLWKYIEPHKDADTGQWVGKDGFADAMVVCWRAMEQWERETYGQLGFPDDIMPSITGG